MHSRESRRRRADNVLVVTLKFIEELLRIAIATTKLNLIMDLSTSQPTA